MKKINKGSRFLIGLFFTGLIFCNGCGSQTIEKVSSNAAANENKLTAFESDLETMRTAGFEYVFVFRRKDGGAFDGEDRKYLKTNSPAETNRFIATDDDKAFIAGSKYKFPPENLEVLRARFDVQNFSAEPAK